MSIFIINAPGEQCDALSSALSTVRPGDVVIGVACTPSEGGYSVGLGTAPGAPRADDGVVKVIHCLERARSGDAQTYLH